MNTLASTDRPVELVYTPTRSKKIPKSNYQEERREYQFMLNIVFYYFVLLGVVTFFLPDRFRPFSGRLAVVGNARRAAHEITPFLLSR